MLSTACKKAADAVKIECGSGVASYESACKGSTYTFEGAVKVACINGG